MNEEPNVRLLRFTPEPEKTIAFAAKLCYTASDIDGLEEKVSGQNHKKFIEKILKLGHLSVLEHVSFTFGIEGISRATTHQLVRHRLASYSQQSQRYVSFKENLEYIIPPNIDSRPELKKRFKGMMNRIFDMYKGFIDDNIPAEDARYILPNAAATKIIVTMNARELLHFFTLRCCERAQWEIRLMAKKMLVLARKVAPVIFKGAGPGCVRGRCAEGEMTCGRADEVREEFKVL